MKISISKKKHFEFIKNCWKKNFFFKKNWWTILINFSDLKKLKLNKVYKTQVFIKKNLIKLHLKQHINKKKKNIFRLIWFRFYKLNSLFQTLFFNIFLSIFDKSTSNSYFLYNKTDFAEFRQQIWLDFWQLRNEDYEKYCYYQKKWRYKYLDNLPLFVRNFLISAIWQIYWIPKTQLLFQNFFFQKKKYQYWNTFDLTILEVQKVEKFLFFPKEQIYWLLLNFYFIKYWLEDNQLIKFRNLFNYYKFILPKIFFLEPYKWQKNFNFFIFLKKKGLRLINFFNLKHFTFQTIHSLHHNLLFYDTLFNIYNIWQIIKLSLFFFNFSLFFFSFSLLYNYNFFSFFFLFYYYNIFQIFFFFFNYFFLWKMFFLIEHLQARVLGFFSGIDKFTNFLYAITGHIFHFSDLKKIFFFFSFFDAFYLKKIKEISPNAYFQCLQLYFIAILSSYFFQNLKKFLLNKYNLFSFTNNVSFFNLNIPFYFFWFFEFFFFCVKSFFQEFFFFNFFNSYNFEFFFFETNNYFFNMRFIHLKSISMLNSHLIDYPTPIVGYMSSFGSLSGLCIVIQIITGILLVAHYTPHISLAFSSVEHIMRDVNDGWLFRYYHSNGASIFFLCLYIHISHNFSSDADDLLWISGFLLYLAIMATAFMGYILPWGQMSFWGATVITNLFAAIPLIGTDIAQWLWGGFSVDNPTLNRFFSFHYLVPFLIVALVMLHLTLLHLDESTTEDDEYVEFYFYYFIKDLFVFFIILILFMYLVFFSPNLLSHPDNYIMASISVTPAHLVPEWYFLPFYAVLRSTPDKFGGLVLMFLIIVEAFLINPIKFKTGKMQFFKNSFFTSTINLEEDINVSTLLILFYLGGSDIDEPYTDVASILSILTNINYFNLNFLEKK